METRPGLGSLFGITLAITLAASTLAADSPLAGHAPLDGAPASEMQTAHAMQRFATAPALFVENHGQFGDPAIRYLHHGKGALIALTDAGPVFQVQRSPGFQPMTPETLRSPGFQPMTPDHGPEVREERPLSVPSAAGTFGVRRSASFSPPDILTFTHAPRTAVSPGIPKRRGAPYSKAASPQSILSQAFEGNLPLSIAHVVPPVTQHHRRDAHAYLHGRDAHAPVATRHIAVTFPGAREVIPRGGAASASTYNYQKGAPETWRENVPTWETVVYPALYDGIDLQVWGRRDHLKYEFHVAPGADHCQVHIRYEGIEALSLDIDGALLIDPGQGWEALRDEAPYVYQDIHGQRIEIPSRYQLLDAHTYTFELLAAHDPAHPLVLDPEMTWGTYLGRCAGPGRRCIDSLL